MSQFREQRSKKSSSSRGRSIDGSKFTTWQTTPAIRKTLSSKPATGSTTSNSADTIRVMPRLAFSTNAFKKNTLAQAIDFIAGIGYSGVELMADVPHAYPPNMDDAARRQTKEQIENKSLVVSNVNAFTLF